MAKAKPKQERSGEDARRLLEQYELDHDLVAGTATFMGSTPGGGQTWAGRALCAGARLAAGRRLDADDRVALDRHPEHAP